MSKKSKTKIETSSPPQSPLREEQEPARSNGPAAPQSDRGWGWLKTSDVEPADAASFDNATWEESRWAP